MAASAALSREHGIDERRIADSLGVSQAAVSKYVNGIASKDVKALSGIIAKRGLHSNIVKAVVSGESGARVRAAVDAAASDREVLRAAEEISR